VATVHRTEQVTNATSMTANRMGSRVGPSTHRRSQSQGRRVCERDQQATVGIASSVHSVEAAVRGNEDGRFPGHSPSHTMIWVWYGGYRGLGPGWLLRGRGGRAHHTWQAVFEKAFPTSQEGTPCSPRFHPPPPRGQQ
jgi:hypothetical protein